MPDSTVKVLVLSHEAMAEALIDNLRAIGPRVNVQARTAEKLDELAPGAWDGVEVLYTTGLVPTPEQAPALRWIQGHFAGVDHVLARKPPILRQAILTSSSGIHATAMGEYVLMMMLAHAHHLPRMLQVQASGQWPEGRWKNFCPRELRGATVGIVGYGSIGREVARLAKAFGMRVLAAKRVPAERADTGWREPGTGDPAGDLVDEYYALDDLPGLLGASDYVVLAVPHTAATHHLIDAAALRAMRRDAILINVGRGGLADEAAVAQALEAGVIGGAALDVFEREPLPSDSPLWRLPNVILSAHVSGFSPHYDERSLGLFAANLRRYLAGEPLLNVVDTSLGY